MRVYISSPINAQTLEGIHAQILTAARAAMEVVLAGHTPVVPQMNVVVNACCHERYGVGIAGETWKRIAFEEIERSDAILFLGADARTLSELFEAQRLEKLILCGLSDLP